MICRHHEPSCWQRLYCAAQGKGVTDIFCFARTALRDCSCAPRTVRAVVQMPAVTCSCTSLSPDIGKHPDMARGLTRNLLQGYLSASRQLAPVTADSEMPGKQSWLGIRTRRPLCVREGRTARKSFYLHNIIQMIDTETQSRSRQERGRLDETRDSPHQPAPSALLHKWHQWPICIRS